MLLYLIDDARSNKNQILTICAITIPNILTLSYNYTKDPVGGPFRLYDHEIFSRMCLVGKESRYIV